MVTTRRQAQAACPLLDPAAALGPDLLASILTHLSPRELALSGLVSKGWRAAQEDRHWRRHCQVGAVAGRPLQAAQARAS